MFDQFGNLCEIYKYKKPSLPVYEVVVEFQHTELGVLVYEEPDVMRQVVGHARLARRYFVRVFGNDVQLAESFGVDQQRRPDFGRIPNIAMSIDVCDGFSVRKVSQQLHGVGDDALVGIDVSIASGRGNRFTKVLEAWLRCILNDLVDTINDDPVRKVPP